MLGRALRDYFAKSTDHGLEDWLKIYQMVRLPRAERVQDTSRELGTVYEMRSKELESLSFEECLPIVRDQIKDRMNWIWSEDIDAAYENARAQVLTEYQNGL